MPVKIYYDKMYRTSDNRRGERPQEESRGLSYHAAHAAASPDEDAHASQLSRAIEWCDDQENCCKRMKELWRMLERQSDVERDLDAVHKQARELIETVDEIEEAARRNFDETSIFWEMMSDIRATLERIARD
ncbi:hypothetical protein HPB50_008039 [Hyalomma asiaticum]|uniref:Uncharacterized protein n=1 Tax=Hyalomma asiaticum TaxID=266040 RepID=A0ACB7TEV5_HYAAI|nr:hypothetical protein HPB50_008039 [Hyalomma asiaticum]